MYVVRRVICVKPGTTLKAAKILSQLGKEYEKAGRSPTRVYWSGYTVPGPNNTIYMDWTQETLGSPYAETANEPEGLESLYRQLEELQEESYIEFYEMV
tara:strand:+ start:1685 stop:1981 length:297 start_codon:yes stop_codon:yes gene_type:complete